jgi:hypothetical protein
VHRNSDALARGNMRGNHAHDSPQKRAKSEHFFGRIFSHNLHNLHIAHRTSLRYRKQQKMTTMASPATAPQEDEASLGCAIRNLLSNTSLADVNLRGTDGMTIPAHRAILAARSQAFEKLLFGSFAEASNSEVQMGYDGRVLQAIVEYCYTDEVAWLGKHTEDPCSLDQIETITNLAAAADYFCFPKLYKRVTDWVLLRMDKNKLLALGILITANNNGATPDLLHAAMDTIQNHFHDCGLFKGSKDFLGHLTPDLLEEIVSNEAILVNEIDLFNLVASWADCNCDSRSDEAAGNAFFTREKRKEIASELVEKHIFLENIIPSFLRDIVEPSGIVSCEKLMKAYKTQSLSLESGIAPSCKRTKRECWESSHEREFTSTKDLLGTELLQCPQMAYGMHSWSIKVVAVRMGSHRCWLGVALASDPPDRNSWLGEQATGWAVGSNGNAFHANLLQPPKHTHIVYGEGSVVKFRLDLTQQGTLSASVDGGEEFLLFEDMLMIGEEKVNRSFVPAVSLVAPVAVRFLGFHRSSLHG